VSSAGQVPEDIPLQHRDASPFRQCLRKHGEACLKAGDAKNALLNCKKALELDPGNDKARETVKMLEAER
jgi:hypothetical protein